MLNHLQHLLLPQLQKQIWLVLSATTLSPLRHQLLLTLPVLYLTHMGHALVQQGRAAHLQTRPPGQMNSNNNFCGPSLVACPLMGLRVLRSQTKPWLTTRFWR